MFIWLVYPEPVLVPGEIEGITDTSARQSQPNADSIQTFLTAPQNLPSLFEPTTIVQAEYLSRRNSHKRLQQANCEIRDTLLRIITAETAMHENGRDALHYTSEIQRISLSMNRERRRKMEQARDSTTPQAQPLGWGPRCCVWSGSLGALSGTGLACPASRLGAEERRTRMHPSGLEIPRVLRMGGVAAQNNLQVQPFPRSDSDALRLKRHYICRFLLSACLSSPTAFPKLWCKKHGHIQHFNVSANPVAGTRAL
jgi:hypothetical protein